MLKPFVDTEQPGSFSIQNIAANEADIEDYYDESGSAIANNEKFCASPLSPNINSKFDKGALTIE